MAAKVEVFNPEVEVKNSAGAVLPVDAPIFLSDFHYKIDSADDEATRRPDTSWIRLMHPKNEGESTVLTRRDDTIIETEYLVSGRGLRNPGAIIFGRWYGHGEFFTRRITNLSGQILALVTHIDTEPTSDK